MKSMKKEKKFKIKNLFKNSIFTFILGALIFGTIGVGASTLLSSGDVTYDNSSSGLSATNLQDAIDELYEQAKNAGGGYTPTGVSPTNRTVYAVHENTVTIGTSTLTDLGTSYATFAEAAASNSLSDGVTVLKYTVENNVLTEGYTCFLTDDGKVYCLKGYDTSAFAVNVAILNAAFPTCGASASGSYASCDHDAGYAYAYSNGKVETYYMQFACYVDSNGRAGCYI